MQTKTSSTHDYSTTLNLPEPDRKNPNGLDTSQSGIPLRANLAQRELQFLDFWSRENVNAERLNTDTSQGSFILHDGPPYSNGNIHIGTAMNKILKDIIVKYKAMQGFYAPYVPGWDNHGLPIETAVTKEFREKKLVPTSTELRKRCREYAADWVQKQKEQFKRLGIIGDWDNPYLTMHPKFEAAILDVFADLVGKGFIYRGVKPVHWCVTDRTALADHEVEYADRTDSSIYVRFPVANDPHNVFDGYSLGKCYIAVWTTTPWTIPANVALAVNPDFDYAVIEYKGDRYVVATGRLQSLAQCFGDEPTVLRIVPAQDLAGMVSVHPILPRKSPVVFADYVTLADGTGVVHTAPGHGREDFMTGQKYGLPTLSPVDDAGRFTVDAGNSLEGLTIWEGNKAVIDLLEQAGALLAREEITHSYPHCWRCHHPVIFRATAQWFMSIDHDGFRAKALACIKDVAWYPSESVNRINAMVGGRPDWCLSRQRAWGVGIPVFYCEQCDGEVLSKEIILHVRDLVAEHSSDIWFEKAAEDLLPVGYCCPKCGGSKFRKETDIFDVWFDSGSTNVAVLASGRWPELSWPADVYLEGGDQHRGWFNSSLMVGVATKGSAPYRQVVTHGWTLDEKGKAMHKSVGNAVAPDEIVTKFGADVLRLWVGSSDYLADVRLGKNVVEQVAESYRRLRNTLRFGLSNLYDFNPDFDAVAYSHLPSIDKYALHLLAKLIADVTSFYDVYEFHRATQAIHQFCTTDMSAFYMDIVKDRLYADGTSSLSRRSAQTVLFEVTSSLSRMLAPVLSFTSEEVWQKLNLPGKPASVALAAFPTSRVEFISEELDRKWLELRRLREEVFKVIETARQAKEIGKPLEASVTVAADGDTYELLTSIEGELSALWLVSEVIVERSPGATSISVKPATGVKCGRCWLVKRDVDEGSALCGRCRNVLENDCPE